MLIELPRKSEPSLFAVVDQPDEPLVRPHRWSARVTRRSTYAKAHVYRDDGRRTTIAMHSLITGWPFVDHVDGDGLNNRRSNLRPSDHSLNARNKRSTTGSTSVYRGVAKHPDGKWQVMVNRKYIGLFDDEITAAHAHDAVATELYGEHAWLNFPIGDVG